MTPWTSPGGGLRLERPLRLARVFLETYGCAFNVADGEAMAGVLSRAGFAIAHSAQEADVIILNTCTVKNRTYAEFEKRFAALRAAAEHGGARLVVAGCIPAAERASALFDGVATLGPDAIGAVDSVVRAALAGAAPHRRGARTQRAARPLLPTRRQNPAVEILPIARGCLSACTFCQTRLARGRLVSFRPLDLLERARRAIGEGVKELWLTAQDTGAYGHDGGYPLPALLERLCALPGDFRIRLGMSSPQWIAADLGAYLGALAHPKMFKFLHVPVQSGSDAVLEAMHRGHGVAPFEQIAAAFTERFPDGALLTDIIVGYPTETEADFAATLALLERTGPAAVNRARFSPRPGTAAARLKPLPSAVVSQRSRRLNTLVHTLARRWHGRFVGRRARVLTAEAGRDATIAHNDSHRPVELPGRYPLGEWIEVEYTGATDFHLISRVLLINTNTNQ